MELPVIEVYGNSYEIGFMHGSKAKEQIAVTIDVYRNMFKEFSGIDWEAAQKAALAFEDDICSLNPGYLEEIKGIADGSGYLYKEILALNVRSEIVFQGGHLTADGCTSLAVTPERTDKATTYLGQNWDWKVAIAGGVILLKIKQERKPDIATMTEAGIIGKIGCNSEGIGVCFNALSVDAKPSGVPLHIILRHVLEQPTLLKAMSAVTNTKPGCPANILIASRYGEAIDFELETDDFEALYPKDGFITHTNHYTSERLPVPGHKDMAKCRFPDTFIRKGRADKLIRGIKRQITEEDIKMIFKDHCDPSASICHHEKNNGAGSDGIGTVFSILMDLKENELYISFGQPCENEYKKYKV